MSNEARQAARLRAEAYLAAHHQNETFSRAHVSWMLQDYEARVLAARSPDDGYLHTTLHGVKVKVLLDE